MVRVNRHRFLLLVGLVCIPVHTRQKDTVLVPSIYINIFKVSQNDLKKKQKAY
jgi:hypothetical protein